MKTRAAFWCVMGAAAALYLLILPRFPIGVYNDDAAYVLAAKSLLGGGYRQLNLPGHPPFTLYPPGFPLALAPFVALLGIGSALKILPFLLTLGTLVLIWLVFRDWLPPAYRLSLLALYAFNPLTAIFSGVLMSESCFIFAILGVLYVMQKYPDTARGAPWALGLLLGWAALIRTTGLVLLPCAALGLAWARRWRTLTISLPVALGLCGAFYSRNFLVADAATVYQAGWGVMFKEIAASGGGLLARNAWEVLSTLTLQNFLSFALPAAAPGIISLMWLVFLFSLAAAGAREALSRKHARSAAVATAASFSAAYLLVHCFWLAVEVRYAMPIVPFILAFALKGCELCVRRFPRTRAGWVVLAASVLILYLAENTRQIAAARTRPGEGHPEKTYAWIKTVLPPDALILASGPAAVHLYTGRFATLHAPARDAEEFRYQLLRQGVGFVLLRPETFGAIALSGQNPNDVWQSRRRWVSAVPRAYLQRFAEAGEQREIFAVQPAPDFLQAYETHLAARDAFDRGAWDEGFAQLERALRQRPDLISAYNAYGVGSLLSGRSLQKGRAMLRMGLRLNPGNPLLARNLARLEERLK